MSEVTCTLVPGVTNLKSPWKTSNRIGRLTNLMPFNTASTTTSASPPLHNALPQPVPVGETGVMVTLLLRVVGLTLNATAVAIPKLSLTVTVTGVSALTLFANTVKVEPDMVGVGTATVLLEPS